MVNKYNLPNTTGGIDQALVGIQESVSIFTPMLLFFIFCIVLLGGVMAQKRRIGYADFPMWTLLASVSTLCVALPMTLVEGLINPLMLGVIVTITLASGLWFFLTKDRGEI